MSFEALQSDNCSERFHTTAWKGEIRWSFFKPMSSAECTLDLSVPEGQYIICHVQLVSETSCTREEWITMTVVYNHFSNDIPSADSLMCKNKPFFHVLYSQFNNITFTSSYFYAEFFIRFTSSFQYTKNELTVVSTAHYSGYVTSPGFDGLFFTPLHVDARFNLTAPDSYDHVMTSFDRLQVNYRDVGLFIALEMSTLDPATGSLRHIWSRFDQRNVSAEVHHTSLVHLYYYTGDSVSLSVGFSMKYSFHRNPGVQDKLAGVPQKLTDVPKKLADGPHKLAGVPQKLTDVPKKLADGPHKLADGPHKLAGVPQKLAGVPQKLAGVPEKLADGPHKLADGPHKLAGVPQKLDGVPQKLDVPHKLAGVPQKLDGVPQKLDVPQKLAGVAEKLAGVPQKLAGVPQKLAGVPQPQKLAGVPQKLAGVPQKLDGVPHKLPTGLFNCSVDYYSAFQQHLDCNLELECEDGRDETGDCPFTNSRCSGMRVASGNKCLFTLLSEKDQTWERFSRQCQERGGNVAVIRTHQELSDVTKLLSFGKNNDRCQYYSLGTTFCDRSLPNMYRQMWVGMDRSVLYGVPLASESMATFVGETLHQKLLISPRSEATVYSLEDISSCGAVCQLCPPSSDSEPLRENHQHLGLSANAGTLDKSQTSTLVVVKGLTFFVCPKKHLTRLFLACDLRSDCGQVGYTTVCSVTDTNRDASLTDRDVFVTDTNNCGFDSVTDNNQGVLDSVTDTIRGVFVTDTNRDVFVTDTNRGANDSVTETTRSASHHSADVTLSLELFTCDEGEETVSFTLVCDFRPDCTDQSDETFCSHPACPEMTCDSGQCVPYTSRCDLVSHCLDNSDEADCEDLKTCPVRYGSTVTPPAVIDLDGRGYFTHVRLNDTDSCPDTHYRCSGQLPYCLPVYTRCNGYYDCLDREDEEGCDHVTCPGFYRCRDSSVCVHVDHVCDGWPQCPQRDDEWLCDDHTCPGGCQCFGSTFLCAQPFRAGLFTHLRYLDGSGTNMTLTNVSSNVYLVYLKLSSCSIVNIPRITLPNLQHLDLADNGIAEINMNVFLGFINLKVLVLQTNPLETIVSEPTNQHHYVLRTIDLSFTKLKVFSSSKFSAFRALQHLNLSHTALEMIDQDGFRHTPALVSLDVRASPVTKFPADVFEGVTDLRQIFSPTYKLCCRQLLPSHFDEHFCEAPQDEISSCEDLLRSEMYRLSLWMMSVLSLSGNVFCLVFRAVVQRKSTKNAFNIFVSCLCLADLLMGVYVTVIGSADLVFRGRYLHVDATWMKSAACQAAGFMSLVSSEVSAVTIMCITVDRFIALSFPFTRFRFRTRSALVACGLSWLFGLAVATVPLLPVTAHWEFYSQTGICVPLPITRKDFQGRSYSFGVMIIFNFIVFVFVAIGQALIYRAVRNNAMTGDTTRKSRDTTIARRLVTVAVTDFLCWVPIGLCGLLALSGVPVPGEVNVAMAIFVLPLNSAFNPFLYTYNVVTEKRRLRREERLLAALEAQLALSMSR